MLDVKWQQISTFNLIARNHDFYFLHVQSVSGVLVVFTPSYHLSNSASVFSCSAHIKLPHVIFSNHAACLIYPQVHS